MYTINEEIKNKIKESILTEIYENSIKENTEMEGYTIPFSKLMDILDKNLPSYLSFEEKNEALKSLQNDSYFEAFSSILEDRGIYTSEKELFNYIFKIKALKSLQNDNDFELSSSILEDRGICTGEKELFNFLFKDKEIYDYLNPAKYNEKNKHDKNAFVITYGDFLDSLNLKLKKVPQNFLAKRKKEKLKEDLEKKYNIVINTIKDNISNIAIISTGVVICTAYLVGLFSWSNWLINSTEEDFKNYQNSIVLFDDDEYKMSNIFVVYDANNVHFCTRKIHKITEEEKISGNFRYGSGHVDEYFYRDEIYEYFDVETKERICYDHQDGFYIENLLGFYSREDMRNQNFKLSSGEVKARLDNDYLLSRDPGLRRK